MGSPITTPLRSTTGRTGISVTGVTLADRLASRAGRSQPPGGTESAARRRRELVARDQVGQPVGLPELQAVPVGQGGDVRRIRRPAGEQAGQLPEEVLEAGRADHL